MVLNYFKSLKLTRKSYLNVEYEFSHSVDKKTKHCSVASQKYKFISGTVCLLTQNCKNK